MPKKVTSKDLINIQNTQQDTNACTVCNGTGKVYFVVTGSFWNKKITPTEFEQPCYKCQKT